MAQMQAYVNSRQHRNFFLCGPGLISSAWFGSRLFIDSSLCIGGTTQTKPKGTAGPEEHIQQQRRGNLLVKIKESTFM
ncbi:hypothetical protein EJB05_25716, partial [Eragrostis curvula]